MGAAAGRTCPRFPTKIQHATREDALEHQKQLVFRNQLAGRPDRSDGLHVYPCPDCGALHVGHVERLPLVWHYTTCSVLDAILESGALVPSRPRAFVRADLLPDDDRMDFLEGSLNVAAIPLSRTFQNRYRRGLPKQVDVPIPNSGGCVRVSSGLVEREGLLWFSRNAFWEHSIDDLCRETLEIDGEGLLRFGVPPSVAKLRWCDYLARNPLSPELLRYVAARADPTEWLATDEPVPLESVKRTEVYYGGTWVPIEEVGDEAFERYLADRPAVYDAARRTLGEKMDGWKAGNSSASGKDTRRGRSHDDLLRYFDTMATTLQLTEAERILLEDLFYLSAQASTDKP